MEQNKLVEKFLTWLSKQEKFADKTPEQIASWIKSAETDEAVAKELATLTEKFKTEVASMKRGGKTNKIGKLVKKCQKGAVFVEPIYDRPYARHLGPDGWKEQYVVDGSDRTIIREVYNNGDTVRYLKTSSTSQPYPINDFSEQVDSLIDANMPAEDPNAGKLYYGWSRGRMVEPNFRHIVYSRDTVPGGIIERLYPKAQESVVERAIVPGQDTIYMSGFGGAENVIDQRGLKALFDRYFNSDIVVPVNKGSYEYRQSVLKKQEGGEFEIDPWKEGRYPQWEKRTAGVEEYRNNLGERYQRETTDGDTVRRYYPNPHEVYEISNQNGTHSNHYGQVRSISPDSVKMFRQLIDSKFKKK